MGKNPPPVFILVSGLPTRRFIFHLSSAAAAERDRPAVNDFFAANDPELIEQVDRRVTVGNDQFDPVAGLQNSFRGILKMAVFIAEIPAVSESIGKSPVFQHARRRAGRPARGRHS